MNRRALSAPDVIILGYQAIVAAVIVATWSRHDHPAAYLGMNLGIMAVSVGLARLEASRPNRWTTFLHSWWPVVAVPLSFKEVAWVVPGVQPFADQAWDRRLQEWDEFLFGDTSGFFRSIARAPIADLVTIGYWSYFPLSLILGGALYRPPDLRKFRESTTILLTGWFLSYLGYFLVPAVGPHVVVDGGRVPELDGVLWAGAFHRLLMTLEGVIPDAFPSGHALIAMLVLILSWRLHRRVFWWLLPFALTLIAGTMYLRYHYVVDVLAAVALVPVSVGIGRAVCRMMETEPLTPSGREEARASRAPAVS
jgi:membrane-associated phospholipid phosphatase